MGDYDTHFPCVSIGSQRVQMTDAIKSRKSPESR